MTSAFEAVPIDTCRLSHPHYGSQMRTKVRNKMICSSLYNQCYKISAGSQKFTKRDQIFVKFVDNEDTVDIIQEVPNQLSEEVLKQKTAQKTKGNITIYLLSPDKGLDGSLFWCSVTVLMDYLNPYGKL